MEVTGITRKRTAAWNWNENNVGLADFEITMINQSASNGFQVSPKRRCLGLQHTNTSNMLPVAPVYQQKQNNIPSIQQDQYNRQTDQMPVEEEMETQTVTQNTEEETRKSDVCLRCLAGEPGHILHILSS
ncbi:uncharacterized protein [Antedon mediterranea]|uniref:uncharacterized protein n=1 Tax=Antedon mediterranea TaxID=105859 RepID=UPI003AF65ED1